MNIQYVLFGVIVLLFIHFVCYFFNVDIFEIMEKQQPKKEDKKMIDENIESLTKSLEELKEITTN
tara:strand:+ start:509 stop:703 length:195 start_codon:yes stop_codon:yes gene_type:complete